jgi:hypothetical protein
VYDKTQELLETFRRRRLSHLVLSHLDNNSLTKKAVLDTCELCSEFLQSLTLRDSNITEGTLVQLLSRCPQLTSLDLSGCNSLFMAGTLLNNQVESTQLRNTMKNVTELSLAQLRYLSDQAFNRLTAIFPSLQKLSLASTQIAFNGHTYYPANSSVYDNSAVFTFACLEHYLMNNVEKIKGLNFSRTTIMNNVS